MRDETFDMAARELGASRRRALLGGFGLALAGLVGRDANVQAKEKAKGPRPEMGVTAPELIPGGPSSAKKKKKTIPVSRCNCYMDGAYVLGLSEMFCYYETPTIEDEIACNEQATRCVGLAALCKTGQAQTCISNLVNRWES